jgi:hypothetical protein
VLAELVRLSLKLSDGSGGWPGLEPALQGLMQALGLALSLGVAGSPFFWRTPSSATTCSNALRPPVKRLV